MEPSAIKWGAEEEKKATAEQTTRRINTKQLNTLTSTAMEGLQTSHHMPCELDIDGKPSALRSISIGYHFLHLCSKKKKQSTALRTGHIQLPQPPNIKPLSF